MLERNNLGALDKRSGNAYIIEYIIVNLVYY